MIRLPSPSMVVLIGPSGTGKSTWAERTSAKSIVSSDAIRRLHPEWDNTAVFDEVQRRVEDRLSRNELTVVDATNLRPADRAIYRRAAERWGLESVAMLFPVDNEILRTRNAQRPAAGEPGRVAVPTEVLDRQIRLAADVSKKRLRREGWGRVVTVDEVQWTPTAPLAERETTGPIDVVGDIRGCADELDMLLDRLGYDGAIHPEGRRLVFVGGLSGPGPGSMDVLQRVKAWHEAGRCTMVKGKEEVYLERSLRRVIAGKSARHPLATAVADDKRGEMVRWLHRLPTHVLLGDRTITHAAMLDELVGRVGDRVEQIAVFGSTSASAERIEWQDRISGPVWYGSVGDPVGWHGRACSVDGGAALGGCLGAWRMPEDKFISVETPSYESSIARADGPPAPPEIDQQPDDMARFSKRRRFETPFGRIPLSPQRAAAGVASMVSVDLDIPYLAPTISPVRTGESGDLERPESAIDEYADRGCHRVCLEAKHMGSRAVVLVEGERVDAWTRSGRRLRSDVLTAVAPRIASAVAASDMAGRRVVLDGELLPWSALADGLMTDTFYAAADAAAVLGTVTERSELVQAGAALRRQVDHYATGEMGYAPFAVLAIDGRSLLDEPLETHHRLIDPLVGEGLIATERCWVDGDIGRDEAIAWWEAYCARGGEGAMVKPAVPPSADRWWPPMLKCRGADYLRLVYGVEYLRPDRLAAARGRSLSRKRSIQRDEYALAAVCLERWAVGEPRFDEMVAFFGIDAEPVDTRL